MQYKVIRRTLAYNKPGLSPTVKNGTDVGWVDVGFTFTAGAIQNGWLSILPNKWVKQSDCESLPETPPPVEPPVDVIIQIREGVRQNGVITWLKTRQFKEE